MADEYPRFEIYPLMEDADPNQPTGQFGWRYRAAPEEDADIGPIMAISARTFDHRETVEDDVNMLMQSLITVGETGAPPAPMIADPSTGVRWSILHVEEA